MPSVENTLCWAIPVNVEVLVEHLQAHMELLPTLTMLRLCNRYGQGSDAWIAKLPIELVNSIEDFLVADARSIGRWGPAMDFRCFRQRCWPIDHLSGRVFEDVRLLAHQIAVDEGVIDDLDKDEDDHIHMYLIENEKIWMRTHTMRKESWLMRLHNATMSRTSLSNAEFLQKYFALDLWISHVRLEGLGGNDFWSASSNDSVPQTVVAFLTLPGARKEVLECNIREREKHIGEFDFSSGYGTTVKIPQMLSHKDKKKFESAMTTLGLTPFVTDSQKGLVLDASSSEQADGAEGSSSSQWPQLMLLTRCTTNSSEE